MISVVHLSTGIDLSSDATGAEMHFGKKVQILLVVLFYQSSKEQIDELADCFLVPSWNLRS